MDFTLSLSETRSLGNLQPNDVIEFESQFITRDVYMIFSIEKDESIPAILLQLWKFEGGFNHAFKNVMENDLGINQQVKFYSPLIRKAKIIDILEYRPEKTNLSEREEFFYDVWAEETSNKAGEEYSIPYVVRVEMEKGEIMNLRIPTWTPLQRLPVKRVEVNSEVEVWTIKDTSTIMKVIKL